MKRFIFALLLFCTQAWGQSSKVQEFGWKYAPEETKRVAQQLEFFSQQVSELPVRDDITSLNYAWLCKALGQRVLPTLDQGSVGACVGFATARAADITAAADIYHRRESEQWVAGFSPDGLYAIGRQVAGRLGSWDGSTGAWSVEGLQKIGTLHRMPYESGHDLTEYDPSRTRGWARTGLPEPLIPIAGEHPFLAAALVDTVAKAKASLQNGYPLITCSMISYPSKRDELGFMAATGRRWAHAMVVAAYRDPSTGREGFLILNSWRAQSHTSGWVTGPIWPPMEAEYPQPIGSFWVSPEDLKRHLDYGDTWAISGYQGFIARTMTWEEVFSQAGGKARD